MARSRPLDATKEFAASWSIAPTIHSIALRRNRSPEDPQAVLISSRGLSGRAEASAAAVHEPDFRRFVTEITSNLSAAGPRQARC